MHIGFIIYGALDTISGGYLYDRQLVRYLQQQGDEVQLISLPWKRYGNHLLDNIDPVLLRELRQSSFDLLLQDELNHPSLFGLNQRLRSQIFFPIVSVVHHLRSSERHPFLLSNLYRWIERQYLRTVDGFICNSETTRAAVEAAVGGQKPYLVAYPAADHHHILADRASIALRAQESGPLRLIFVGNVIPRKGCHVLLTALADLPKGSWQLKMVGDMTVDPSYVRQMKYQAYSSGISTYIHWHGRLSNTDLTGLLAASHVLVVPSSYEGFGIVYLEGMGHGLPAIATTSGATHEIITDSVDGFLVPPDDPLALANRIQTLSENRALLAQQSLAALDRAYTQPTWDTSMARVRNFLLEMIR